eukprot:CAMPEP_0174353162 /NCGR_PEP_ID=MMETSP0811_2-20130205/13998_1 /TAXON_ID=73025 ORGANISM="Eutreptiella gymnastica-like, Strain CCMP1594" /NCGR_SAMPLE_ID=MMETSP0811_2 /ASSEMBLY_ACC=CAM_ASM_000667 /LENGTH=72 /DNA_ID=CAMNT_0015483563 /DNA_START=341 /DNA_END=556 /DNA_ORIENTATION=-
MPKSGPTHTACETRTVDALVDMMPLATSDPTAPAVAQRRASDTYTHNAQDTSSDWCSELTATWVQPSHPSPS